MCEFMNQDTSMATSGSSGKPATPDQRDTSHWPKAAASAVVFRDDTVLIVERGKGSLPGLWSLPGGHIEAGETARAAAEREVMEETGTQVQIHDIVDVHDVILRDPVGTLTAHYVLSIYFGVWQSGEPQAASDARSARFVHPDELAHYKLTPRIAEFVARARHLLAQRS